MKIFGFTFGKSKAEPEIETIGDENENLNSFQIDDRQNPADMVVPEYYGSADYFGLSMAAPSEQSELIKSYRELAAASEVDEALEELRNEIFIFDVPDKRAIELDFEDMGEELKELREAKKAPKRNSLSDKMKEKIVAEFENLYELVEFDHRGTQYFDDWYVDSVLCVHKIINKDKPKEGIKRIELIDPLRIRKVKVLPRPNPVDGTINVNEIKEFYVYGNFDTKTYPVDRMIELQYDQSLNGLRIAPDSITYINSGLWDRSIRQYVGFLKKAIVPYNNLKLLEDSMVIFRVVRAPARRAIYIDVSGMPKGKSEQYIKSMMARYRNKMTYDSKTGTLSDRRNVMSMLEDYWLPRRSEGKTTEITTLEGQNAQDILEEVEYQRDKLWRALGVPRGRFGNQPSTFLFGKGVEIQRDEYRFTKFCNRLRSRFILFFEDLLKTQLILKNIIAEDDWEDIRRALKWRYTEDNNFVEYKEAEIWENRFRTLDSMTNVIGKYVSPEWAARNILRMTQEQYEEEQKKIEKARKETPHLLDIEPDMGGDEFGNEPNRLNVNEQPETEPPEKEPKETDE